MLDVITIGHSTIDIIASLPEAHLHSLKKEKTKEICFSYGQKLSLNSVDFSLGGNAPNVAVGLKRLGFKTAIVSNIGRDENSLKVRSSLEKEGVNDQFLRESFEEPTDVSVILNFDGERTILAHHSAHVYLLAKNLPTAQGIYLTSLGENFKKLHEQLIKYLTENSQTFLFYNPGPHELKWGISGNREILYRTKVLFVNREELAILLSDRQGRGNGSHLPASLHRAIDEVKMLLSEAKECGPEMIVMTDGENGAYTYDGNQFFYQRAFPTKVVEKTGAGDAFSTGFVAAILGKKTIPQALAYGSAEASSVIGKIGSTAGLLNKKELQDLLDSQKEIVAESF